MRHTNQILDQLPAGSEIDRVMLLDYFQKIIGVVILRAAPSSLNLLQIFKYQKAISAATWTYFIQF